MIEVKNLEFSYGNGSKKEIENINLNLEDGLFTCLIGHNGAGKSTLMKLIYGCLLPSGGYIRYKGKKISRKTLFDYRSEVAFVTQEDHLHMDKSILSSLDFMKLLYPELDQDEFIEVLARFGLEAEKCKHTFGELSSGEKMQIMVALAFARHPRYMILDEPYANLDPLVKTELTRILHRKVTEGEMGVLLSTHLLDEITDIVDHVVVLEKGRIISYGSREDVLAPATGLKELLTRTKDKETEAKPW